MPYHDELLSGDDLTTLVLNFEWRRLIADALQSYLDRDANQLTDTEYDDAKERIYLLIHDIYTIENLGVLAHYHEASRASTQAIAANTDTKIQFNVGATPPQDWNVPVPAAGICTVTARVVLLSAVAGAKSARLLHNDNEIAMLAYGSTALSQVFTMSQVLEVESGDYFSLQVNCVTASNAQIAPFTPKISIVVVE